MQAFACMGIFIGLSGDLKVTKRRVQKFLNN